jgi:phosphotransferase system enzyme I (PtsI)
MFLERKKQWRTESGAMETRTSDGVRIPLLANIELPREVDHCLEAGAEGIGLYRTEYLFLNRSDLPSEEEQYHAFSEVARRMHPRPVVLRTLDIGGDKLVSVVQNIREMNPQLGWRAVRFCLARPDIFKTQMRAMLRASVHGNVHVMFPMISSVEEIRAVHAIWEEVKDELRRQQIPFSNDIPLGSMIEIPSAVLLADALAKYCAFFSIGTNDLIQYSLAVDRGNEKIAHLYEPAHPAVLKMIYWTATAAARAGISCSVCGEMAGDPLFTELLLGLGVTSLSMSSVALPAVRATVAAIRLEDARSWAQEILSCETSAAVRQAIEAREVARADASKKLR